MAYLKTIYFYLQMIILPFIPILALIVQTSFMLNEILVYRRESSDIETQVINKLINI